MKTSTPYFRPVNLLSSFSPVDNPATMTPSQRTLTHESGDILCANPCIFPPPGNDPNDPTTPPNIPPPLPPPPPGPGDHVGPYPVPGGRLELDKGRGGGRGGGAVVESEEDGGVVPGRTFGDASTPPHKT
jgi:hypothetical protein